MPVNNGDGVRQDVLVWGASDLGGPLTRGSSFCVTGDPDLMAFKCDEGVVQPRDFVSGDAHSIDPNQTLSGTPEGQKFKGNHGTTGVFEFETALLVQDQDGNQFHVYQIDTAGVTLAERQ